MTRVTDVTKVQYLDATPWAQQVGASRQAPVKTAEEQSRRERKEERRKRKREEAQQQEEEMEKAREKKKSKKKGQTEGEGQARPKAIALPVRRRCPCAARLIVSHVGDRAAA